MSKLDELKKRERELLYQLEDNGKEKYRTKELLETFEGYDRASHRYQSDLWETLPFCRRLIYIFYTGVPQSVPVLLSPVPQTAYLLHF